MFEKFPDSNLILTHINLIKIDLIFEKFRPYFYTNINSSTKKKFRRNPIFLLFYNTTPKIKIK